MEDSFESDGVAVDYADPGPDNLIDDNGTDALVIDTTIPNGDTGAESMHGDVEESKFGDLVESKEENLSQVSSQISKVQDDKASRNNDDEPYLEIMVSEQEFDDVGEMNGQSGKGRNETEHTSAAKSTGKPSASASKSGGDSSSAPTSSTATSSARRSERTTRSSRTDRAPASSADNQVTSSEKSGKSTQAKSSKPVESDKKSSKSSGSTSQSAEASLTSTSKSKTTEEKKPREREDKPRDKDVKTEKPRDKEDKVVDKPPVTPEKPSPRSPTSLEVESTATTEEKPSVPPVESLKAESPEIGAPAGAVKVPAIQPETAPEDDFISVSIRNLAKVTTANQIKEKLSEIATVFGCTIFQRKGDERYAIAKFRTTEDCNTCVEKFNDVELDGNVLVVALAPKRKTPSLTTTKQEADGGSDKKRQNGDGKSDGRCVVRTKKPSGPTEKDEKNIEKPAGSRSRPLRIRSPIRPPARSPTRTTRPSSSTDRPRRAARAASPVRTRTQRDIEQERQRADFEERRRVIEWKRSQQDRMRREEDLMKRKAEVEALRLERERARLKLERERLEAERLQLERQKNRDRELLERDRKRREDEERRQRQERERERERERDTARRGEKRSIRDFDRDSDRLTTKRRSPESSSRSSRLDDRDRDSRRDAVRGYERPRAASPRRRGSPDRHGSPSLRKVERYVESSRGFLQLDHHRHSPDRTRNGASLRDAPRRFEDFRAADRGSAADFGTRRPESGRGDHHWNGNSGSYSSSTTATAIGATSWTTPLPGGSVVNSSTSGLPYGNGGLSGSQTHQYDRYSGSGAYQQPTIRGGGGARY